MRPMKLTILACSLTILGTLSINAEETKDARTLVKLPSDVKEKMVVIMRDHIHALEDIIDAVQTGKYDKAENIVESRLGWSSPLHHEDQEVIKHWPEPMQKMADQLYHAANNYVYVSQKATKEKSETSNQNVIAALGEMITACRNCHETYRIR